MESIMTTDIGEAAHKMKEGAVELKSAVIAKGADTMETVCCETESYIKSKPYQSVLVAFAVGALAGLYFSRR